MAENFTATDRIGRRLENYEPEMVSGIVPQACDRYPSSCPPTAADFRSEEEFRKWKSWSDENYHIEDKLDVVERKHTVPIDQVCDAALTIPGIDVVMIRQHESAEKYRQATVMIAQFKDKLTKTQFRRLCLYFIDEMSVDEIGEIDL